MELSQILGFVGAAIVIVAYLPQVTHLIKEHCAAGISLNAYLLWFVAALLLLTHALMIDDLVFTVLQGVSIILIGIICVYAYRYRAMTCQTHASKGS